MENIKAEQDCPYDLSTKAFKLLIKWKQIIEEWYATGGEQLSEAKECEYKERMKDKIKKNVLKPTTHSEKYFERKGNFESSKSNFLLKKNIK